MATREDLIQHHPRSYENFTWVYPVLSRRGGGVSLGVNLNLDKICNFDCPYCQVDRSTEAVKNRVSVQGITAELEEILSYTDSNGRVRLPLFAGADESDIILRDIALSGDGEPTSVREFAEICSALAQIRRKYSALDFKLVLITNATLFDRPLVMQGIDHLMSASGEIWAKLDAGTDEWYQKIDKSPVPFKKIISNLNLLAAKHPFKIQTLFCSLAGAAPSDAEVDAWVERLVDLKKAGASILEVQIHTIARTPSDKTAKALDAAWLQRAADKVVSAGISAKVYG